MFYICNVKVSANKNRERRNDQGRKELKSHCPQVMEQPWMQYQSFMQTIYWRCKHDQ